MRSARGITVAALCGLLAVAACDREEPFGPGIDATAELTVRAFVDLDGRPGAAGPDEAATGLRFQVVLPGSNTPVAEGVADAEGMIEFTEVPVGTYDLRVDPSYLADTLVVTEIDSARVTLTAERGRSVLVGVTPPDVSMSEVRTLPEGRRAWVTGMVLNRRSFSVDGSIHVRDDATGEAIRVVFAAAAAGSPGDSARVLGRTVAQGARRYLVDGRINVLAQDVRPLLPQAISVAQARTAGGGAFDARLVVIEAGIVVASETVPFLGQVLTIQDGGAQLTVVLLEQNGFPATEGEVGSPVERLVGLLVPEPQTGNWRLVPRGRSDSRFGDPPDEG